jgi:amidohydrolase
MHNWPWLKTGQMAVCEGATSAACDEFYVTLTGVGGHAAFPHKTKDVVVCGAQIVSSLQHLVSRTVDPTDRAVLSVTNFNAGTGANNILPESMAFDGTIRTLNKQTRIDMEKRFHQVVKSIAAAHDIQVEIKWHSGYPSTVNTPKETDFARDIARELVGEKNVHEFTPMMGGEDFAYFLKNAPAIISSWARARRTAIPACTIRITISTTKPCLTAPPIGCA